MNKKEFKEEFGFYFNKKKVDANEIERFLACNCNFSFELMEMSVEDDYWMELRTDISVNNRFFYVIYNHDFQFWLDEYTVDELWDELKSMEKDAKEIQKLFKKLK